MSALIYRERPGGGRARRPARPPPRPRRRRARPARRSADVLDPERRLHVVTPRAPLQLPGWPGHHWYVVPRVGYPDPDTFHAAYAQLAAFHDELWERTGVDARATVFGGFSMGSVMSYSLGLGRRPPRAGGHPRLLRLRPGRRGLAAATWPTARTRASSSPTAASDPIMEVELRPPGARAARGAAASPVDYHESDAGHHIDPAHVPAAVAWLGTTLAAAGADAR